jgi:hypothetical protein
MSVPVGHDDGINNTLSYAPPLMVPSPAAHGEQSQTAHSLVPAIADAPPTAPGIGCPPPDPAPPRVRPIEANIALKNMRGRWLLDPDPVPKALWIGKLSFAFSLTAVALGAALLPLPYEARKDADGIAAVVAPLLENRLRPAPTARLPRLVVQSRRGFVNEPVPLDILLADASGEETLTLLGLVAGTKLSAGTPLGSTGWQLPARELGNAFAYAPRDFVGVMDALIDLRSASNQPIDVRTIRLEWIQK